MISLYVGSVSESGLRRALTAAPPIERAMLVSGGVDGESPFAERDREVRAALTEAFAVVGAEVHGSAVSASYALPVAAGREVEELAVFAFYEELGEQARLVEGRWPAASGSGPVAAAVPEPAARRLGLETGDTLVVTSQLSGERVRVSVSGRYDVIRPDDAYWLGDTLGVDGVDAGTTFTTYGPLVVPQASFLDRFADDATASWRVDPELAELGVADLPALQRGISALGDDYDAGTLGEEILVESDIVELLAGVETPLLVARSAVAMPAALLVVLAGYALLLTTRLLGEHRAMEVAVLRARGMSSRQLLWQALREALVLTVPAALLAPLLATLLLRGYDTVGPLADAGVRLDLQPVASTWLVAALAAAGSAAILIAPARRAATTFVDSSQSRGRQSRRTGLQRAGADLLLAVVAGLAYWQLLRYGSPVLTDVTGQLAVDPLLVLAPALVLLAVAVLALRLVPLLATVAERLVARGRGATAALGAWQLSRRPRRYTGPALLLIMATAIGALSVTYATAWTRSQQDQADFRTGADLRVEGAPGADTALGVQELPGVSAALPVVREETSVGETGTTVLAVDAAALDAVVALRPDLAEQPQARLAEPLVRFRPDEPALRIPMRAESLVLPLRVGTRGSYDPEVSLAAVLRDREGLLRRVDLGNRTADSRELRLRVDLSGYAEPPRLVAVEVSQRAFVADPGSGPVDGTLQLRLWPPRAVAADGSGLGRLAQPSGSPWRVSADEADRIPPAASLRGRQPDAGVRAVLDPGCCNVVRFAVSPADLGRSTGRRPLPALVSARFADVLGDSSRFVLETAYATVRLRVVGELAGVPTVDPGESAAVLVDLPSLQAEGYAQTRGVSTIDEWWLSVREGDADLAAAALRTHRGLDEATLVDRDTYGAELRADPVGVGVLGALSIGFLAAASFAIIGFGVSATVSARERSTELGLLRAIGIGPRQLTRMLGLEQAVLVGLGVSVGLLIGVVVARLVVPVVTLTEQATRPFPAVLVTPPWWQLGLLGLAIVGALALVVVGLAVLLRGRAPTAALRLGEDT